MIWSILFDRARRIADRAQGFAYTYNYAQELQQAVWRVKLSSPCSVADADAGG